MASTINITRGLRVENEAGIVGAEALESTNVEIVENTVAAGAVDADMGIGPFEKFDLDCLAMVSDQDVLVRLNGEHPHDISVGVGSGFTAAGPPGQFEVAGDVTGYILPGDEIYIEGATTAANDGPCTVLETAFAAGITTITVARAGGAFVVEVSAGAGVTMWRKFQYRSIEYDVANFTVAGPPGQLTYTGDLTDVIFEDDNILVEGATTAANDGIYTVTAVTEAAGTTTITVAEAIANVEAGAAATSLALIRDEFMVRLSANVPFLWSEDASIFNPLLEDVTMMEVTNDNAVTANFQARIGKQV